MTQTRVFNATTGELQAQGTTLECAEQIIAALGESEAFSSELDNGLTIEQAREAMASAPDSWLTVNGWEIRR